MNPYEDTTKLDNLFEKLNSIAHDRAGLFDTPIVNEVLKIIESEKEQMIRDIWKMSQALYNPSVEFSDVTKSNYEALKAINYYCAKMLGDKVEELFNLIEQEKKDFWCDIALYVAKKKVDWYMDFVSYGAEKLGLKVCDDCKEKLDELIKEN